MTHWSRILANRRLLSNHFCKACQNCLHPSFVIVHKAVRLHLLLLCCESSRKCYHAAQTTPTWTKPSWHVLQKLLLCSHPWPNMNELCTKLKFTNYTIMRWNQFRYICFQFWEILSQTRVFFYATQSSWYSKLGKKVIWTCLTKMIADQSSVSQYA